MNKTAATYLKNYRESKGLSVRQMAAKVGIHHATLHRAESGKPIGFKTANRLCKSLTHSTMWFMDNSREE